MAEGPDGSRAWCVAVAALVINMITAGIFRAQGMLFVEFINEYKVDRKGASVPFSVRTSMRNLLAPVVGVLGQRYGVPTVTVIGGILGTISSALCFIAPDILWITVIWGVINGISTALITVLPQVVIGQYFVKHRTTASGLSFSGGCSGSLFFPTILEILLQVYGLNGTFFILAGMFAHIIPAAMLLKKPNWLKSVGKSDECVTNQNLKENILPGTSKMANCKSLTNDVMCYCSNGYHDHKCNVKLHGAALCKSNLACARAVNSLNSFNGFTVHCHDYKCRENIIPNITRPIVNKRVIPLRTENFYDIDLEYLKRMSDLVFQMFAMELPNMEVSYRAILLEVEQDELWHPEKNEIMHEIENMYVSIENSLEMNQISENTINANGLYIKRTHLNEVFSISKKSQSLRAVKKYFRTYREKGLWLSKIRSAPNISNIYNELARREYIQTKLRSLYNSNEIRIISHLSHYNPKDVLKVLFQVRSLFKLYIDLESNEHCEVNELSESLQECTAKCTPVETEISKELPKQNNSIGIHVKNAFLVHTNPIFLLICLTRATFFVTFNPVMTTIVDFAMDRGLQEEDGKFIIGALSFGDLMGRICLGWITDRGYATLPRYMLVVLILLGATSVSIPHTQSKWTFLPSISLFGMLQGSLFIRHPVLVAKYMQPEEQAIAVGCMDFSSGILCIFIPFYIGYFRDSLGTYNSLFYINGIIATVTGMCWLLEPWALKKNQNL